MLNGGVLALEVSQDRRHRSVAAAAQVDGVVVVQLVEYGDRVAGSDGRDDAAVVQRLQVELSASALVVDPMSNAANVLRHLRAAGVVVIEPAAKDVACAYADFMDELQARRIKVPEMHPALELAVRHADTRSLAGGQAWQRLNRPVDVAPLTAATLAVWRVLNPPAQVVPLVAWR